MSNEVTVITRTTYSANTSVRLKTLIHFVKKHVKCICLL